MEIYCPDRGNPSVEWLSLQGLLWSAATMAPPKGSTKSPLSLAVHLSIHTRLAIPKAIIVPCVIAVCDLKKCKPWS